MKKLYSLLIATLLMAHYAIAEEPFKGTFECSDLKIKLVVDLYEESIEVPGMSMFGPLNGYLRGSDLYCTWYVSTVRKCDDNSAVVHFSNELGSETQAVEMALKGDSILTLRQKGGNTFKKVVGKKLQKLPTEFTFKRTK